MKIGIIVAMDKEFAQLTTLATDMTHEVETRSTRLLSVLEPLLIVVMFAIIGSLLMAVMLPMLTLSSRVNF